MTAARMLPVALTAMLAGAPAAADPLVLTKSVTTVSDPLGNAVPRALPGSVADYRTLASNPLANLAMFVLFTLLTLFMICSGFALYSEGAGIDSWQAKLFGWVFSIWPNSQQVHTLHHLGMWAMVVFILLHVYAAIREDITSRQSMISAITTGDRHFRDDDD